MATQLSILATIILTTFSSCVYSQSLDSLIAKRIIISTSLTDYIPNIKLNTGNYNIGAEIYLRSRKSVYANIGLIKSYGPSGGTGLGKLFKISSLNTHGLRVQIEGRQYLNRHKIFTPAILFFLPHIFQYRSQILPNTGYYVALNSSCQWTATDRQEAVVDYIDNDSLTNSVYVKENIYTVDRNAYGLNIKFGYQCIKKSGLTIDHSIGIGGLYLSSHSTNRIGSDYDRHDQDFPSKKLFDKGVGFAPNIIYHIGLGWGL